MIQNVDLFRRLHGVNNVYLLDHMLCGAVCSHIRKIRLANTDDEIANIEATIHSKYLIDAHSAIKQEFPDMNIFLYLY